MKNGTLHIEISSPLDQFEVRDFLSLDAPILADLHISITNIGFYLTTALLIILVFIFLYLLYLTFGILYMNSLPGSNPAGPNNPAQGPSNQAPGDGGNNQNQGDGGNNQGQRGRRYPLIPPFRNGFRIVDGRYQIEDPHGTSGRHLLDPMHELLHPNASYQPYARNLSNAFLHSATNSRGSMCRNIRDDTVAKFSAGEHRFIEDVIKAQFPDREFNQYWNSRDSRRWLNQLL